MKLMITIYIYRFTNTMILKTIKNVFNSLLYSLCRFINHIFMIASQRRVSFLSLVFVVLKEVFIFQKDLITSLCLLFCVKEDIIIYVYLLVLKGI